MLKIGIILGSTRPGRVSPQVGKWAYELAKQRTDAQFEIVDIADFNLPVVADAVAGFPGPLAGILAGLDWVALNRPDTRWMLSAAADCPLLPRDLVSRLDQARRERNAPLAVATSGGQSHHVVALWSLSLREPLRDAVMNEGFRAVGRWMARYPVAAVEWPVAPFDPFFNANTPDDLAEANRLVALDDARS